MKWCSYDAEGDAGKSGLIGVSVVSDKTREYITNETQIIECLREHARSGYTFISHNAQYDIPVVFWQLKQDVCCVYYNKKFNHGEWLYDSTKPKAKIWDSLGLSGNISLLKLGKSIGLPKYTTPQCLLPEPTDHATWYCEKHNKQECVECYAIRDAEIVYEYMLSYQSFLAEYNIKPKRTIGSAAVAIWKEIEQIKPIALPQPNVRYGHKLGEVAGSDNCNCNPCTTINLSRRSYFGGRVDCFKIGKIHGVYCADVTSMYPYCMVNFPMPSPDSLNIVQGDKCRIEYMEYEGVTMADIYQPDTYIPILPVNHNEKLLFPVGTFTGVWCNCELREAIRHGARVLKLHKMVYSTTTIYPFTRYIQTLMDLRFRYKRAKDSREQTVKILLNSLYGRIGIRETQEESSIFPVPKGKDHRDYPNSEFERTEQGPVIIESKLHTRVNKYANVMWASHITAYARLHLYSYLSQQDMAIVYCDTDSVFSTLPIQGLDEGLGQLSDNGYFDTGHIICPKLYSLERDISKADYDKQHEVCEIHDKPACQSCYNTYRAKGVPKKYAEEFIKNGSVSFEAPYKPREAAHLGVIAGQWHTVPRVRRLELTKRVPVSSNNNNGSNSYTDTLPITLKID